MTTTIPDFKFHNPCATLNTMHHDEPHTNPQTPTETTKKNMWKNFSDEALSLLKYLSLALIIVIPIRLFVAQPFVVSGDSMVPTFQDRNYLIIDEITFSFRKPHRGEVIVFRFPNDPKRFFIKRVIGLPGETLVFNKTTLTIKNAEHPKGFVLKEPYVSELPINPKQTVVLANDEYFVMGDNRPFSSDSRYWGPLPEKNIIGRAVLRLWPITDIDIIPGSLQSFNIENYEVFQ